MSCIDKSSCDQMSKQRVNSSTERVRRWRQRIKLRQQTDHEISIDQYRARNAEYQRNVRARIKLNQQTNSGMSIIQYRARNAEIQRKCRERIKRSNNGITLTQYRVRNAETQRRWREKNKLKQQTINEISGTENDFVYKCFWPICESTFSSNYSLLCHLSSNHNKQSECVDNMNDNDLNDNNIKQIQTKESEFTNDLTNDTIAKQCDEQIYQCYNCGQKFKTLRQTYDHMVIHIDKPFKCDFCDNRYDSINELLNHRDVTHFIQVLFECNECSYKTNNKTNLHLHQRRVHKKEKNFICEESECNGKAFFTNTQLKSHEIRFHSNIRVHCIWPECGRSFLSEDYLKKHLKWHSGDSNLRCDYTECNGKVFASKFALRNHRLTVHSDEKPIACHWPECSARFKVQSHLTIHMNSVHNKSNERNFKCGKCEYRSFTKYGLYTHNRRVHQKLKKFICDVLECNGKRFYTNQELDFHKSSIHSDKRPFVCDWPQCNSAFKLKNNLYIHIKKVHTRI